MTERICTYAAALMGLAAVANGTIMLVSPVNWYFAVPGVTTTGPFNQHFVRDIGLIYLFVGLAFLTGAVRDRLRVILWGAASLWLASHALFHAWEVAAGICGPSALLRDFAAVTLPAIIGGFLTCWTAYRARRDSAAST